jgi:hypothetical protein
MQRGIAFARFSPIVRQKCSLKVLDFSLKFQCADYTVFLLFFEGNRLFARIIFVTGEYHHKSNSADQLTRKKCLRARYLLSRFIKN